MDSLLHLLPTLTVQELLSVRLESSGPYAICFPAYEHIKLVSILRGRLSLQLDGEAEPMHLRRGDCYMLTNGSAYRVFNAAVPETDAAALFTPVGQADRVVRLGQIPADTVTIGSRVVFPDDKASWLRRVLAPVIRIPAGTVEAARIRTILRLLSDEPVGAPGASLCIDGYVEVLLVQVLRHLLRNGTSEPA